MATFQVLRWQEIPTQIRAEEGAEEVNLELDARFQELIDRSAQERGQTSEDDYLAAWAWDDPQDRPGSAQEVAEAVKRELEKQFGFAP